MLNIKNKKALAIGGGVTLVVVTTLAILYGQGKLFSGRLDLGEFSAPTPAVQNLGGAGVTTMLTCSNDFNKTFCIVDPIPTTTTNRTPTISFTTKASGNVTAEGGCTLQNSPVFASSEIPKHSATLESLSVGTYNNCLLKINLTNPGASGLADATVYSVQIPAFTVESLTVSTALPFQPSVTPVPTVPAPAPVAPKITEVKPVPEQNYFGTFPEYTFNTDQAGRLLYGDCYSETRNALAGDNTITLGKRSPGSTTLEPLDIGVHDTCRITVDNAGSFSSLIVNKFEITPSLYIAQPVPNPSYTATPSFILFSAESGKLVYGGGCGGLTKSIVPGKNEVFLGPLSDGIIYKSCTVALTSMAGVTSSPVSIPEFGVKIPATPAPAPIVPAPVAPTPTVPVVPVTPTVIPTPATPAPTVVVPTQTPRPAPAPAPTPASIPTYTAPTTTTAATSTTCAGFKDVSSSDKACAAIKYVKSTGAMTGNPDGTFEANELLQRDQIAKIVLKAFAKFSPTTNYCLGTAPFIDVGSSSWALQYICRAKTLGVVTGYRDADSIGLYKPAQPVTRAEFLAILLRNINQSMNSGTSYRDVDTNAWYANYARYSKLNSLFTGDNLFPNDFTTRKEVAEVIYKLHNLGKL
jgi:hypothetical protein